MTNTPPPTYLLIRETDYTYDDGEKLVLSYTTYIYDEAGRLIEKLSVEYDLDERIYGEEPPFSVFSKNCYEHNIAGNPVKRLQYDEAGALQRYVIVAYDNHGNKIHESYFKPDDSPLSTFVYEYDNAGRRVRQEWRTANDELRDFHIYSYDDAGQLHQEEEGNADGTTRKIQYEYNAAGQKTKQLTYNREGTLTREQSFTYNERGQQIGQTQSVLRYTGEWDICQAVLEYDEHGHNIACTWRTDFGLLMTREVYDYDEHGNQVKVLHYSDDDLPCSSYTVYEYQPLETAI